jgi:lipid-A-disaccharide synthase
MKFFLIAGEPSGDVIGEKLIRALKLKHPDAEFAGVGGPLMESAGMEVILPMRELTVMGIWEVMMRIPHLWKLMIGILEDIDRRQPDFVITVDFPDFNFILGQKLKKRGDFKGRLVHYVAPTVWAWRPGRAKKIAQYLDGLICLLPFEPPYFEKHGLKSIFIGHPVTQENPLAGKGKRFREERKIPDNARIVGLFFGSREEEFENLGKVITEAAIYLHERFPNLYVVMPTLQQFEYNLHAMTRELDCPKYIVLDNKQKKWDAFAAMEGAIAVSGTVGLELAYADVPHVTVYKTSSLNWLLVRLLVKVKYAHLANIIVNELVVPEFLQNKCKPEAVADKIAEILNGGPEKNGEAARQRAGFAKMRDLLGLDVVDAPSDRAASFILALANTPPKIIAAPQKPGAAMKKTSGAVTSASSGAHKAAPQGPYTIDGAVRFLETVLQSSLSTAKSILQSVRQRIKR